MQKSPTKPAAKFWELLRRSECFRRAAAWLAFLRQRADAGDTDDARHAREVGRRMLHHLDRRHGFASVALRWLVPSPLFVCSEIVVPHDRDPRSRRIAPETIRRTRQHARAQRLRALGLVRERAAVGAIRRRTR